MDELKQGMYRESFERFPILQFAAFVFQLPRPAAAIVRYRLSGAGEGILVLIVYYLEIFQN